MNLRNITGKTGKNIRTKKLRRTIIAGTLTLCLIAGMLPLAGASFGASEFTSGAPFAGTGRSTYYHSGRFSGNLLATGVDVSTYQSTNSNWKTAKVNGVDFAIMRVTWTGYGSAGTRHYDDKFATLYKNAKAAGVMVGAYVFSQAKTVAEAKAEANLALTRLRELGITPATMDLPIYMDYEYSGPSSGKNKGRLYGISKTTATNCANAFCKVIRDAGYTPGIYANRTFFKNTLNSAALDSDIDLWCAQYYLRCESAVNYNKWQFSSSGKISGILLSSTGKVGNTDVNFWYLDKNSTGSFTDVYGPTEYNYTGNAIQPKFEVYSGNKLLTEGRDYTIGGINNVAKGTNTAYAYIRGIGSYSGYMLVPYTIGTGYITRLGLGKVTSGSGYIFDNISGTGKAAMSAALTDEDGEAVDGEVAYASADKAALDAGTEETAGEVAAEMETSQETAAANAGTTDASVDESVNAAREQDGAISNDAVPATDEVAEDETAVAEEGAQADEFANGTAGEENIEEEVTLEEEVSNGQDAAAANTIAAYSIGTNSFGSYVRNVQSGLTVRQFLAGLKMKSGYSNYSLAVINSKGVKQADSTRVTTGMMLGVYKSSTLVGTADITVAGTKLYGSGQSSSGTTAGSGTSGTTAATGASTMSISGYTQPTELKLGAGFDIRGLISSNYKIKSVKIAITDTSGNEKIARSASPNSSGYNLINLDAYVKFGTLAAGTYVYKVIATDEKQTKTLVQKQFKVIAPSTLKVTSATSPTSLLKGNSFTIKGTVKSNFKISKVQIKVVNSSGTTKLSATAKPKKTSYSLKKLDSKIKFGKLAKGTYYYKVIATDSKQKLTLINKKFTVK